MRKIAVICLILVVCAFSACGESAQVSGNTEDTALNATDSISDILTEATDGYESENDTSSFLTSPPENDGEHERLVAHAGGAVYGFRLTNSLEALDNAYENGFRLMELDFERTSDGKYVLLHDWESMAGRMLFEKRVFTLDEFKNAQCFMDLTLLDLEMLLSWLVEHPDCFIITDAKCGNEPFLSELFEISGELSGHFIPQAYSYEEYALAKEIGFERIVLTLYQMGSENEDELFGFAEREDPFAITLPMTNLTETLVSGLAQRGIYTYAHSVNDLSFYEMWSEYGLYGIYTDYFYPTKFPY